MTPEALDSLSKPELVALAISQGEQLAVLQARVTELEAWLDVPPKTPDNSSQPPSSGRKANVRTKSKKRRRKGRPGVTRQLAENPDEVRDVFAEACSGCGREVPPDEQDDVQAYDHIELPPIAPVVTRVQLHGCTCSCCGKRVIAKAPADMPPGSPFGPGIVALVVYLHTRHMVSFNRLVEMLRGLFGLEISEGAIANMLARAGKPFAAEAERIEAHVRQAPVIASDETSARVLGQNCSST
ncbi:MAG: IS66 family transposase, partial [bacterium]|nr:IS66 family transposase [bacterium]